MVFHDRRLQYTEHQQLEGWKWNRPGDRLLDLGNITRTRPFDPALILHSCDEFWLLALGLRATDIPMSVGIVEPKTHTSQLNAAEFLWDMKKRTSVFVQVTHTQPVLLGYVHKSNPTTEYILLRVIV